MSPVMIGNFASVVLFDGQDPVTQSIVIQTELGYKAKIMEHPHGGLRIEI